MKPFNFRLQRLLGFRHMQEEEAKRELGLRRLALEEETARLSSIKREEQLVIDRWQQQVEAEVPLPSLQVTQEYSRRLETLLERQAEQYKKSRTRVEEQREVAMQCWRKKKMLEALKDKAGIEHRKLENIEERKLVDEIVINTFNRKGGD